MPESRGWDRFRRKLGHQIIVSAHVFAMPPRVPHLRTAYMRGPVRNGGRALTRTVPTLAGCSRIGGYWNRIVIGFRTGVWGANHAK